MYQRKWRLRIHSTHSFSTAISKQISTFFFHPELADKFGLLDFGVNPILNRMYAIVTDRYRKGLLLRGY